MIFNLDSKIINGNEKYNESLKYWINPSKKIKAVLLYRLSDNGDNPQTLIHQENGKVTWIHLYLI